MAVCQRDRHTLKIIQRFDRSRLLCVDSSGLNNNHQRRSKGPKCARNRAAADREFNQPDLRRIECSLGIKIARPSASSHLTAPGGLVRSTSLRFLLAQAPDKQSSVARDNASRNPPLAAIHEKDRANDLNQNQCHQQIGDPARRTWHNGPARI